MKTTKKTTNVEKLLFSMYTENTGSALWDSGNAYGRHHERNSKLTLKKALDLPSVTFDLYNNEATATSSDLCLSVNLFKYLINCELELNDICEKFNKINKKAKDCDFEQMYGVSLKAGAFLQELNAIFDDPFNSYNDSIQILSQVIQGCYVTIGDNKYILLQIHGGCDVRGGYTNAKLFKLNKHSDYLPMAYVYGYINGISVDNTYNGYSLTDEQGKEVVLGKNPKIDIDINVCVY